MKKIISLCSALLLLSACGGSGDSMSSNDDSQSGANPNNPPFLINNDRSASFAGYAVINPENMLQLGDYSYGLVQFNPATLGDFQSCKFGGGRRMLTVNQALPITAGTVITETLENCFLDEFERFLNGEVKLTVQEHHSTANSSHFALVLDLSNAAFVQNPELTLLDPIRVTISQDNLQRTIKVQPQNNRARFRLSNGHIYTLSQFELTKEIDFSTALYGINYEGRIASNNFSHYLTIASKEPLKGYLYEYPHEGLVEVTDVENNKLQLTANHVVNSNRFDVQVNDHPPRWFFWRDFIRGNFWSLPGEYREGGAIHFGHNNFSYLGFFESPSINDFPINGTLSLLFSRELSSVDAIDSEQFFRSRNLAQYPSVAADFRIEGAILHITPRTPLQPNTEYLLNNMEATNTAGVLRYFWTSSRIITSSEED